ncbi:MAG: alpha/beta hydrolase, partial [Actinobacteria bacterium]|nr:alpha/beta hydrolase [Actinomycetota bacterium]
CLIIWGSRDETLPVSMGYKLAAQLPRARLVVVPGCMHSVHLEEPVFSTHAIRAVTESGDTPIGSVLLDHSLLSPPVAPPP